MNGIPVRLRQATAGLRPPFAVVDLDALADNAASMISRARGLPIRVATKSVRCRSIVDRILAADGFSGVMAYSLDEAIWLARSGQRDILVAYPTADRPALIELATDHDLQAKIMIMVDSVAHLALIAGVVQTGTIRVCLDVDASLRLGPLHLGVRRSPVHTVADAAALATQIQRTAGIELQGVMFYDAQIAGLPDHSAAVRMIKRVSAAELLDRRAAVLDALAPIAELTMINGGGTGSLHVTSRDRRLTELAGGSGLYGATLFDHYRDFRPEPAAYFVTSVVRKPTPRHAVVYSGGYIGSGPPGWSRQPTPWWPRARLLRTEGAGEVQTPIRGRGVTELRIGDQVWFRQAKAGEPMERIDRLQLVQGRRDHRGRADLSGRGKELRMTRADHTWSNWAGNVTASPRAVARAADAAAVAAVVTAAAQAGRRVKAVGSGHSFSPAAATDGVQLRLDQLTGIAGIDPQRQQVTVAAGTTLADLNRLLDALGLALENLGDIDHQTVSGAISTGTHGTGSRIGGLATQVRGLRLVLADGTMINCSADEHPDIFAAARVGLGALGVITEVTLQCVAPFRLRAIEGPAPLDQVLESFEHDAVDHDHVEFYWFPHTEPHPDQDQRPGHR